MTAARWNIVIEQGANLVPELTWEADGTPVDLTGTRARWTCVGGTRRRTGTRC